MKPVTIYVKQTCPYCINAKRLLDHKGVIYNEFDVTKMSQQELEEVSIKTNHYRTVPKIFIGDEFIGGFDDLNKLNTAGKLDEMLS